MVRILGIDPGSRCTGYGVIQDDGKGPVLIAYGAIRANADSFSERLKQIYDGVHGAALEHQPGEMAIEQVFLAKNADSALKLGQARGAAICAAMNAGLPVFEYAAREVKQALVGRGSAEKSQVQYMIRLLLGIGNSESLPADASDALGIAMCHLHHRQTRLRMEKAAGGWR